MKAILLILASTFILSRGAAFAQQAEERARPEYQVGLQHGYTLGFYQGTGLATPCPEASELNRYESARTSSDLGQRAFYRGYFDGMRNGCADGESAGRERTDRQRRYADLWTYVDMRALGPNPTDHFGCPLKSPEYMNCFLAHIAHEAEVAQIEPRMRMRDDPSVNSIMEKRLPVDQPSDASTSTPSTESASAQ